MKRRPDRRKYERGAVIFESVMAICILCLILLGMLQIYKWAQAQLFCNYAVFYNAKAVSLGYKPYVILRSSRVAAIAISGGAGAGRYDEEDRAKSYMMYGDASGVQYPYWHPQLVIDPCFEAGSSGLRQSTVDCYASLRNMPLLNEAVSRFFGIGSVDTVEKTTRSKVVPYAATTTFNYSTLFLAGSTETAPAGGGGGQP